MRALIKSYSGGDYELDEYDIFPVQAYYVNDAGSDEVSGLYVH